MTEKTYNGWTNYETWLVALWMDNEHGTYSDRCEMAEFIWRRSDEDNEDRSRDARIKMSDWVESYVRDMVPNSLPGFISDLVGSALSDVDWREIADNWLSEQEGYEAQS